MEDEVISWQWEGTLLRVTSGVKACFLFCMYGFLGSMS